MDPKTFILVVYVGANALMVVMAIPLVQGRIKPNLWYGFRIPKTLNNEEIWYKANAYAGKRLIIAGIITMLGTALLYALPLHVGIFVFGAVAILLGTLFWATIASFLYVGRL